LNSAGDIARQPYERGDFSVKVSFVREKGASRTGRASRTRVESGNLRRCALRGRTDRPILAVRSWARVRPYDFVVCG